MPLSSRPAPTPSGSSGGDHRFHISVVCSGNICRSPIGEQVLRAALDTAGLADQVRVTSAGIGNWHVGQAANAAAARVLRAHGYAFDHVAHQINSAELATVDLALAADRTHLRDLRAMLDHRQPSQGHPDKVVLLRDFDPSATSDEVPDPYGGPDAEFVEVLKMIEAATPGIVDEIRRRLTDQAQP